MNPRPHSRSARAVSSQSFSCGAFQDLAFLILGQAPVLALCLALGPGCKSPGAKGRPASEAEEALPVRVEPLASSPYQQYASGVATLEPWRQVSLRSEAPGRILAIRHEVGDAVAEGALLVQLDGSVAWSSFQAARAGIEQARVGVAHAELTLARMKRLHATGDIPKAQLDQAQNAHDAAHAALRVVQAQVAQVGTQLKSYWVRAPFAGVLTQRPVQVGDYLSPGSPVFTLSELRRLKVVLGLDPAEGLHVKKGAEAVATVTTMRGPVTREARVHLVRPLVDAVTRRVELELEVDNADGLLRPGVVAELRLPLGPPEPKLLVSAEAVVELLGQRYVYVVRSGAAERVPVTLGISAGHRVEIRKTERGPLAPGEAVVVEGVARLYPGARVTVVTRVEPSHEPSRGAAPPPGEGKSRPKAPPPPSR